MSASRLEKLLWPRWLPETARMPVLAQITGAVALTALIMAPWWSRVDSTPAAETPGTVAPKPAPEVVFAPAPVAVAPPAPVTAGPAPVAVAPAPVTEVERPAHLNLDVRHSLSNVTMLVTVDGKRAFETKLEGSGKKFKMFGKRPERSFTRTLDLQPGVRLVRVNLRSEEDRFDQTRVERFELGSASVASLRINADKAAGITAVAERPPVPARPDPSSAKTAAAAPAPQPVAAAAIPLPASASSAPASPSITQQADALAELLNSLRSMLIAIAGFVASAATGFVVQEYLRSKKGTIFATAGGGTASEADLSEELDEEELEERRERRRRRRSSAQNTPAVDS